MRETLVNRCTPPRGGEDTTKDVTLEELKAMTARLPDMPVARNEPPLIMTREKLLAARWLQTIESSDTPRLSATKAALGKSVLAEHDRKRVWMMGCAGRGREINRAFHDRSTRADFMSYDDASACAQKHDIKSRKDYHSRYKQINADLPPGHKQLPFNPDKFYKDQG